MAPNNTSVLVPLANRTNWIRKNQTVYLTRFNAYSHALLHTISEYIFPPHPNLFPDLSICQSQKFFPSPSPLPEAPQRIKLMVVVTVASSLGLS